MPRGKRQPLSARIDSLKKEVQSEIARLKRNRDAIDKELGLLSEQYERLGGAPYDERVSIRRGPKPGGKRKGRRGAKSAKLAELGGKIFAALKKDVGTKFTTARIQSIVGEGAPVGPAYKAYNKGADKDRQIHASGPGRGRQYWVA